MKQILVLGVGNILCTDEGLGVYAVQELATEYEFPANVELMDGGTLGVNLIGKLSACDVLIIADAVLGNGTPGTLYYLTNDALRKSKAFRDSMHQTDLVDTLQLCGLTGKKPDCVVIGMQPENWHDLGIELTPSVKAQLPYLKAKIIDELITQHAVQVKQAKH